LIVREHGFGGSEWGSVSDGDPFARVARRKLDDMAFGEIDRIVAEALTDPVGPE
jgi:hypothetical protein